MLYGLVLLGSALPYWHSLSETVSKGLAKESKVSKAC